MSTELRVVLHSQDRTYSPGTLVDLKQGQSSDPGYPQPQAAQVESARLLANDARQALGHCCSCEGAGLGAVSL